MKILLVSNMYPSKSRISNGIFVKRIEQSLLANGFDVRRAVLGKAGGGGGKLLCYIFFYCEVFFKSAFGNHDYVYVHYVSHCSLPLIFSGLFKKNNIVSHVHGGDVLYHSGRSRIWFAIKSFFAKKLLLKSSKVLVPSRFYREVVGEKYGRKKGVIVYPSGGVDTTVFSYDGRLVTRKCRGLKIGFAGRMVKSKNVDVLIDLACMSVERGCYWEFEVVGDGEELSRLRNKAVNKKVSDRVSFLPSKSTDDLAAWYKGIDFLVYPSEAESLGLVPLEAMASGAIPVVSNIAAFKEYIVHGENGYLCNCLDDYFSSIFKAVQLNSSEVESIRENAVSTVIKYYDSKVVEREIVNAFI